MQSASAAFSSPQSVTDTGSGTPSTSSVLTAARTLSPTLLMTEDLSLFGSQRTEILERFEPLMGDKAATE